MSKLVAVPSYGDTQYANERTAERYQRMLAAMRSDGIQAPDGLVVSGWRSIDRQRKRWEEVSAEKRGVTVAAPGQSLHNTGDALDIWMGPGTTDTDESPRLVKTATAQWLKANAARFDLVHFDFELEPWHVASKDAPKKGEARLTAALATQVNPSSQSPTRWGWSRAGWVMVPLLLVGVYALSERG